MPAKMIDKLPEPRKDPPAPVRAVSPVASRPAAVAAPAAAVVTAPSNGVAAHQAVASPAPAMSHAAGNTRAVNQRVPVSQDAAPATVAPAHQLAAAPAAVTSAHPSAAAPGAPHAASSAAPPQPRRGSAPRPTSAIDLQGAAQFAPGAWTDYIQSCHGWADVDVRWGTLAPSTTIAIQCDRGASTHSTKRPQPLPIAQPFFAGLPDALAPALFVTIDKDVITGFAAPHASGHAAELAKALADPKTLSALGLAGFTIPTPAFHNAIRDGHFVFGADALQFSIASWLSGALTLGLEDDKVAFAASAKLAVRGLAAVDLHIARDKDGHFTGELQIPVTLGKASGNVLARYVNGDVSITGTVGYASDKLSGSLTVLFGDVREVHQAVRGQLDPGKLLAEEAVNDGAKAEKTEKTSKGDKGIGAYGQFTFAFTDWMTGSVLGILDPFGHVTTVGKIAPPKEIVLLKATAPVKRSIPPFPLGASARYGLPYVADVHIGFEFDLGFSAGIGPAVLTDIVVEGTYSTDPAIAQDFALSGAFRISAYAALQLGFSVFAGATILGHDINAGGTITGSAGIKAYAEARPKIGYRETADPLAGKKGEAYLQGHLEAAAQPVLGLAGEAWIKLSAPWWSPVSDHTWPFPLFNYEWPLASSLGLAADIDYVIGSGKLPDVKLGQVDFDASKFSDALLGGDIPSGKGSGDPEKAGTWAGVEPKAPATPAVAPPKGAAPAGGGKAQAGTPSSKSGRGRQTPEQSENVPRTPDASRRWLDGMQALAQLHERAEHDPEDAGEIHAHLAAIQKRFGFTRLEPTLAGDYWEIDAELNPRTRGGAKKPTVKSAKRPEDHAGAEAVGGTRGHSTYEVADSPVQDSNTVLRAMRRTAKDLEVEGIDLESVSRKQTNVAARLVIRDAKRAPVRASVSVAITREGPGHASPARPVQSAHGARAGHVRFEITGNAKVGWMVELQIDGRLSSEADVQIQLRRELREAARILVDLARSPDLDIKTQRSAGVFRQGDATELTHHDHAAAAELRDLSVALGPALAGYDVARKRVASGGSAEDRAARDAGERAQRRLDAALDSMGFRDPRTRANKTKALLDILGETATSEIGKHVADYARRVDTRVARQAELALVSDRGELARALGDVQMRHVEGHLPPGAGEPLAKMLVAPSSRLASQLEARQLLREHARGQLDDEQLVKALAREARHTSPGWWTSDPGISSRVETLTRAFSARSDARAALDRRRVLGAALDAQPNVNAVRRALDRVERAWSREPDSIDPLLEGLEDMARHVDFTTRGELRIYSTPDRFEVRDPSLHATNRKIPTLYTTALLDGGDLLLDFLTRAPGNVRGMLRGEDQFRAALAHFEGRVTGIRARWSTHDERQQDNIDAFNNALRAGKSMNGAAFATHTGRWARNAGFTTVSFLHPQADPAVASKRASGGPSTIQYGEVVVRFTR